MDAFEGRLAGRERFAGRGMHHGDEVRVADAFQVDFDVQGCTLQTGVGQQRADAAIGPGVDVALCDDLLGESDDLGAGLRGGGNAIADDEVAAMACDGGIAGCAAAVADLLNATFGGGEGQPPQNP